VATGLGDGTINWVRVAFDADNGSAAHDTRFYTSTDGVVWSQLGATISSGGVVSIFDGSAIVEVGSFVSGAADLFVGKVYFAELRNGIDGSVVSAFDPSRFVDSLTETAVTGEVWTINQSGDPKAQIVVPQPELILDPYPLRRGRLDVGITEDDGDKAILTAKYEDRLRDLERPREFRWTKEDQEQLVPGDTGFDNVAALQDAVFTW
jgi:hypothetical protein